MKLPDKFQMRTRSNPGFTNTIKLNAHGDYEVTWARGFERVYVEDFGILPTKVFDESSVRTHVQLGSWIIVDERPKQDELPNEFQFKVEGDDELFRAKHHSGSVFRITWDSAAGSEGSTYEAHKIKCYLKEGSWKIVNKRTLSAEEQRRLADFKERVAQLEQSIKLNEQDIAHKQRLIENYEGTKQDLLKKIKEIET